MSNKIDHFEDLDIWKKSSEIAVIIYKISETGVLGKDFGAKDQIRRAALSISSNIAEGFEYNNNKEFVKFLKYSKGSSGELRSQLFVLAEGGYIESDFYKIMHAELIQLSQQIANFMKYLKKFERDKIINKIL